VSMLINLRVPCKERDLISAILPSYWRRHTYSNRAIQFLNQYYGFWNNKEYFFINTLPLTIWNCQRCLLELILWWGIRPFEQQLNPLNAKLNPIYNLLVLLGAHHIFHVSRIGVKDDN
jgi:hypothetical protein